MTQVTFAEWFSEQSDCAYSDYFGTRDNYDSESEHDEALVSARYEDWYRLQEVTDAWHDALA